MAGYRRAVESPTWIRPVQLLVYVVVLTLIWLEGEVALNAGLNWASETVLPDTWLAVVALPAVVVALLIPAVVAPRLALHAADWLAVVCQADYQTDDRWPSRAYALVTAASWLPVMMLDPFHVNAGLLPSGPELLAFGVVAAVVCWVVARAAISVQYRSLPDVPVAREVAAKRLWGTGLVLLAGGVAVSPYLREGTRLWFQWLGSKF